MNTGQAMNNAAQDKHLPHGVREKEREKHDAKTDNSIDPKFMTIKTCD